MASAAREAASARDREIALASNAAFGVAVIILLAWANGRFAPWVAVGLLAAVAACLGAWLAGRLRQDLERRTSELAAISAEHAQLLAQNGDLRRRVEQAHRRGVEMNERSLRRIGADLHDGPAQLLGLVLLKLDELAPPAGVRPGNERSNRETLDLIRRATSDALDEIRNTARGLVLPDIEQVTLAAALEIAIKSHQQRRRVAVRADIGPLPAHVPLPMTISLFRFAQEGLNNGFRHAGGKGQAVTAGLDGQIITVEVSDTGSGFEANKLDASTGKLGLAGLKQRLESLGGSFEIRSAPGNGTRLIARFPNPAAG